MAGMNSGELKQRTKRFAVRIFNMANALPHTTGAQVVAKQVLRSASSVAANYRAACRARSPQEFIAKLGVVEEEADETLFWLEMLVETGTVSGEKMAGLIDEANQLTAIFVASRKTSKQRSNRKSAIGDRRSA